VKKIEKEQNRLKEYRREQQKKLGERGREREADGKNKNGIYLQEKE
jgi:hypothetical protein